MFCFQLLFAKNIIMFCLLLSSYFKINVEATDFNRTDNNIYYINNISNYKLTQLFRFKYYESDLYNISQLLLRIIEFCVENEMDSMIYKLIFNDINKINHNNGKIKELISFDNLTNNFTDEVLNQFYEKYSHKIPNNNNNKKDKKSSTLVLDGNIKKQLYLTHFCNYYDDPNSYTYHSEINNGTLTSLRDILPFVITSLNEELSFTKYELANPVDDNNNLSLQQYWEKLLGDVFSVDNYNRKKSYNFVDYKLCIRIMINHTLEADESQVDNVYKSKFLLLFL